MASEIVNSEATEAAMIETDFAAALDPDTMRAMEAHARDAGVSRRIMLGVLTRSKEDLVDAATQNPEIVLKMLDEVDGYREHLRAAAELADTAHLRVLAALTTAVHLRPELGGVEVG